MNITCTVLQPEVWAIHWQRESQQGLALRPPSVRELRRLLLAADEDPRCRALVLLSQDPSDFCRGLDLTQVGHDTDGLPQAFAEVLQLLHDGRFVSLAVVTGQAMGGGVGLAAACDHVLATPSARFSLPEALWGLLPAIVYPAICSRVGQHHARWMAITTEAVDAAWAHARGLVDHVVGDLDAMQREVRRLLRTLLRSDPRAVQAIKQLVTDNLGCTTNQGFALGVQRAQTDLDDPQRHQGVAAFLAGDLPAWSVKLAAFHLPLPPSTTSP